MENVNILILDDERRVRDEIGEFLSKNHFQISKAEKPSEAFKIIENESIDIAIVDIKLPEMDGLEVLKQIKISNPAIEVIMISGHGDMGSVIEALRRGASDYFQKPFRLDEMSQAIFRTKRFIQMHKQLSNYNASVSILSERLYNGLSTPMIGESEAFKKVLDDMKRISTTDNTSVLILGESGTGKELVAHGIHHMSSRRKNLFHSVNCSAITDSLFESEFFGHKKGSFTGAFDDRAGWFEVTNKGTLFLDEIGDMPLAQQAKLLRTLEERKVSKVGTHQSIDFDIRIIAASNHPIEKMIEEKKFRQDLYHRLSTFIIHLPPLRERREDIPILVHHFVEYFAQRMKKNITGVNEKALNRLIKYPFPGNIRELRNIIERAVILCDDKELQLSHFDRISANVDEDLSQNNSYFDLELLEKNTIERALASCEYSKAKASVMLNITWQALDRKMKKWEIPDKRKSQTTDKQ
jgi:DNA-binding NtrC family response regulator